MGKRHTLKSKMEFAGRLKRWRKRHGFSQSQAAQAFGLPKKTLQNWEIARTRPSGFSYTTMLRILSK